MTSKISNRLLHLLYQTKHRFDNDNRTNKQIIIDALGELYSSYMKYNVLIEHCAKACLEIQSIPEFQKGFEEQKADFFVNVLLSPYNNYCADDRRRLYPSLQDQVTLELMFDSMLSEMLSYIRMTNISWCQQYIDYRNSFE